MSTAWQKIDKATKFLLKKGIRLAAFLADQLKQIQEGGPDCLKRKLCNLWDVLSMSICAPGAVYLNIDWPKAYLFLGSKLKEKHKKMSQRGGADAHKLRGTQDKVIEYYKKYISYRPDLNNFQEWVNINSFLYYVLVLKGEYKESYNIVRRVASIREELIREHQLDQLGFEFIDRSFAYGSIGVYERLEVYIKAVKLGLLPSKKLILLKDPKTPINNSAYLNCWRKHITVISDPQLIKVLMPFERFLTAPFKFLLPFKDRARVTHEAIGMIREAWHTKHSPLLTLTNEKRMRGRNCLKKLGVPENAWFVCLHVRESGFNERGTTENFRNSDISTFLPSIESIVEAGGWVIRIGDPSMTPLPEMANVIDYALSDFKSDWMDIFLCAQCRFFVGTSSGMWGVATTFGVPIVMTNFLPGQAIYYFSSKDIIIPRLCWLKKENRHLNFGELLTPPVSMAGTQSEYDKLGLNVIGNEPEEIRDLVLEMLDRMNGTLQYSVEDEKLQKRFRALSKECNSVNGDDSVVYARIGRSFLQKYQSLLPAEPEYLEKVLREDSSEKMMVS